MNYRFGGYGRYFEELKRLKQLPGLSEEWANKTLEERNAPKNERHLDGRSADFIPQTRRNPVRSTEASLVPSNRPAGPTSEE